MARRVTPAQFQRMVRQAQQKEKQAIDRHNRDVRAHYQKVKQEVNKQNNQIRLHNQKVKQAENKHNREVRAYNSRVHLNRDRLKRALTKLNQQTTTQYVEFRISVDSAQSAYERLEDHAQNQDIDQRYSQILDLAEREAANNIGVMNALLEKPEDTEDSVVLSIDSSLQDFLGSISSDLLSRWQGALFSLNPKNPDAARHFCTSAREVITQILEIKAPDDQVQATLPGCETTENGNPTRRSKIRYFLYINGTIDDHLEDFIEQDMKSVVQLFRTFNDGTHGTAGHFNHSQLIAIKKRVEDGISFLSRIIN